MIETFSRTLGYLWGRHVMALGVARLRRRAGRLDLVVCGAEHLRALDGRPCVVTSNHVWPADLPLGRLAALPVVLHYQPAADSFLLHRAVREQAGRALQTVARCDSPPSRRPWKRRLQERLSQPFARGQMEGLPGYVPVERNPGRWLRPFLEDVRRAVGRGEAILIFPGGITLDRADLNPHTEAGAFHIARRHDLPVLPACLLGGDSWRPGHPVTVAFGPAFTVAGRTRDEVGAEIVRRTQALHAAHAPAHRLRARPARTAGTPLPDTQETRHVASL